MRPLMALAAVAAFLACQPAGQAGAGSTSGAPDRVPVLLELFTSEGCSSCPPADRLLQALDRQQPAGAELIVVSEHVDYWNHLGWADPFSSAFYSERQRAFAKTLATDEVYTPELVVDGRKGFVGSERGEADAAIQQSLRIPKIPITVTASREGSKAAVHIGAMAPSAHGHKSDLYVVVASDRASMQVAGGENSGHTLTHVAVAYSFTKVGDWDAASELNRDLKVDLKSGPARVITFVQDRATGHILAVAQAKI